MYGKLNSLGDINVEKNEKCFRKLRMRHICLFYHLS